MPSEEELIAAHRGKPFVIVDSEGRVEIHIDGPSFSYTKVENACVVFKASDGRLTTLVDKR